ncbi:MAG: NUDIX domain-containing protein [Candidatus Nomurabacteria bacterium]|jgi:8-oxo-dGTP pyrophosphatase MutT (NUDIX family)|nr:NUDIX domain-containing protein [Candidatus Nomurabacteria bacterium]
MEEYRAFSNWPYGIGAGGVVFRRIKDRVEVLILWRNDPEGKTFHLPKGTLHHDETLENCARREVEEESGASTEIVGYLGAHTRAFKYTKNGADLDINKTVHYFAMEFREFSRKHDNEHDGTEWLPIDDARKILAESEGGRKEEFIIIDRLKDFFKLAA